jgi:hypothetical protein
MKKTTMEILVIVCLVLCALVTFAAEKETGYSWFKPSLSVGYAFSGDTNITFTTKQVGLGGITKIDAKVPDVSGIYVAGELPFALTDRLKLALGGRCAFSISNEHMNEVYNEVIARRKWESENRYWVTADLSLSYAFIKNFSFIRDVSAVLGFRWDYQSMKFKNPQAQGVLSSPVDTISFRMNNYTPVFGLTSTFKGFKYGILGGDVKLGVFGSPVGWGKPKFTEEFGNLARIRFDGDFNHAYYFNVLGEITALSAKITKGVEASVSVFAQYTKFYINDDVTGKIDGIIIGRSDFDFKIRPNLATVGIKASMAF